MQYSRGLARSASWPIRALIVLLLSCGNDRGADDDYDVAEESLTNNPPCYGGGGLQPNAPWPMVGLCSMHRAQGPEVAAQTATKLSGSAWTNGVSLGTSGGVPGSPALAWDAPTSKGTAYVGVSGTSGKVYAVDSTSGALKWSVSPGAEGSAAIGTDGTVYIATYTTTTNTAGVFKGLNPSSGATVANKSFAIGGLVTSGPAFSPDGATIYISSRSGKLVALNTANFTTPKWTFDKGSSGAMWGSPAVGPDGTVYIGADNGLYAVSPTTGAQLWTRSFGTSAFVRSSPVISPDGLSLYIGTDLKTLEATKLSDHSKLWTFTAGGIIRGTPAIASDGTIYFGAEDKKIYAVKSTGTAKWTTPFATNGGTGNAGGNVDSSPALGWDATIYVGSDDKKIYALKDNGTSASILWSVAPSSGTNAAIKSGVAIGRDGTVYFGSGEAKLWAYGPGPTSTPDTTCDGKDDNHDGLIDNAYAPHSTACGVGACARTGSTSCVNGAEQDSCLAGTPAASDTTCNGVDDNCNGTKDEGYVGVATNCGVGACARTGTSSCVSGAVQQNCTAGTPAASDATCNGVDDNCNGTKDEGYVGVATSCGVGACARTGTSSCVSGAVQQNCTAGTPAASDTTCNGVDDNCNGSIDEGYAAQSTTCGVGLCSRAGGTACVSGAAQNACITGTPLTSTDTTCNGLDDNCNGTVDEGCVLPTQNLVVNGSFDSSIAPNVGQKISGDGTQAIPSPELVAFENTDTWNGSGGALRVSVTKDPQFQYYSHNSGALVMLSPAVLADPDKTLQVSFRAKSVSGATLLNVSRLWGGTAARTRISTSWQSYQVFLDIADNTDALVFNLVPQDNNFLQGLDDGAFLVDDIDVRVMPPCTTGAPCPHHSMLHWVDTIFGNSLVEWWDSRTTVALQSPNLITSWKGRRQGIMLLPPDASHEPWEGQEPSFLGWNTVHTQVSGPTYLSADLTQDLMQAGSHPYVAVVHRLFTLNTGGSPGRVVELDSANNATMLAMYVDSNGSGINSTHAVYAPSLPASGSDVVSGVNDQTLTPVLSEMWVASDGFHYAQNGIEYPLNVAGNAPLTQSMRRLLVGNNAALSQPSDTAFAQIVLSSSLPSAAQRAEFGSQVYANWGAPFCGNGVVEGTEECDDGNTVDTDACRNNCTRPLVLDRVSAPAAGAYSVAKKLRSAYAGGALRVRRSSDNAESDIGFPALNLLGVTGLGNFCGASDCYVSAVYDQSGNGRNLTQSTAASQIKFYDGATHQVTAAGSVPVLSFIEAGHYVSRNDLLGLAAGNPAFSIAYAGRYGAGGGNLITPFIMTCNPGQVGNQVSMYYTGGTSSLYIGGGSVNWSNPQNTLMHTGLLLHPQGALVDQSIFSVDGVPATLTWEDGVGGALPFQLQAPGSTSLGKSDNDLAGSTAQTSSIIVWPSALSAGDQAAVATLLSPRYCGNGIVESGEQCDDGNTIDTDACRNDCTGQSLDAIFGSSLVEYWDARAGTTLSNGHVSAWAGQKQGITVTAPVAANQPGLAPDGAFFAGKPVVQFTGGNQFLATTLTSPYAATGTRPYFAFVGRMRTSTDNPTGASLVTFMHVPPGPADDGGMAIYQGPLKGGDTAGSWGLSYRWSGETPQDVGVLPHDTQVHLFEYTLSATTGISLYVDGQLVARNNNEAVGTAELGLFAGLDQILFCSAPGGNGPPYAQIAELSLALVILLDSEPSTAQRAQLLDKVRSDWGTSCSPSSANDCIASTCGDGNVTGAEQCDPGPQPRTATCDTNCTFAACGDGRFNPAAGETCDNTIRAPENCPTTCDDGNACTTDTMTGAAATCNVVCTHAAVTACVSGDGCCPAGCRAPADADCHCGNAILDPGEQCDDGNAVDTDSCHNNCTFRDSPETLLGSSVVEWWDSRTGYTLVNGAVQSWVGQKQGTTVTAPLAANRPAYGADDTFFGGWPVVQTSVNGPTFLSASLDHDLIASGVQPYAAIVYRVRTVPTQPVNQDRRVFELRSASDSMTMALILQTSGGENDTYATYIPDWPAGGLRYDARDIGGQTSTVVLSELWTAPDGLHYAENGIERFVNNGAPRDASSGDKAPLPYAIRRIFFGNDGTNAQPSDSSLAQVILASSVPTAAQRATFLDFVHSQWGTPLCGDGITEGNEQCDDGNTVDTDGCHNDCTVSPACSDSTPCTNGRGPCTANTQCAAHLTCAVGIGSRYGLADNVGVCCQPACGAAGTPDGCGGTCPACAPGDTDQDGIPDCVEQNDNDPWTDPLIFNGVAADFGVSCGGPSPSCSNFAAFHQASTCFTSLLSTRLDSGWDFYTSDDYFCQSGFGFAPALQTNCSSNFAVHYQGAIQLAQSGQHCFSVVGSTNTQCGALFVDRVGTNPGAQLTGAAPTCYTLPAGVYPIEWFYATGSSVQKDLHVDYCFGGNVACTPTQAIPNSMLRTADDAQAPACPPGGACTDLCPCREGGVCDPNAPHCAPGLACRAGVGDRFGQPAAIPVCWDATCDDYRSPDFECGSTTSRCGLCPTCARDCTGKSCGSDGCWGRCGAACGAGQAGCESDADCGAGLACFVGAGASFGLPAGRNVCEPIACRSLVGTDNPCRNPANQGQMTACGTCPTIAPDCAGKNCGPDGAGGTCGATPSGAECTGGVVLPVLNRPVPDPIANRPVPPIQTAGVGTIPGEFAVSHGGDAVYTMPITLPPGRGGLTPSLALSYSSGRGNGFVGAGWALDGMESITRCNRTFASDNRAAAVQFDDSDAFCLNGERLVPIGTRVVGGVSFDELAPEHNDFSSILAFRSTVSDSVLPGPDHFEMTKPDGHVLTFGGTPDSQIRGPLTTAGSVVQTWALSRIADRDGNYAEIAYELPSEQVDQRNPTFDALSKALSGVAQGPDIQLHREYYPTTIRYSLHPNDPNPQATVVFEYDDTRSDKLETWHAGMMIQINRRLSAIAIYADRLNRRYALAYEEGVPGDPRQSRLVSVQQCVSQGILIAPTTCMPGTTFGYERSGNLKPPVQAGVADNQSIEAVLDFDGDGRDDLLVVDTSGAEPAELLLISRSNGSQPYFDRFAVTDGPNNTRIWEPGRLESADLQTVDWDNDGRDDLVDLVDGTVYLSRSDSAGTRFEYLSLPVSNVTAIDNQRVVQYFLLDVDGDGRKDLLECAQGLPRDKQSATWRYALHSDTGVSGWGPSFTVATPKEDHPQCPGYVFGDYPNLILGRQRYYQVADVDGDGTEELLFAVDSRLGMHPEGEPSFPDNHTGSQQYFGWTQDYSLAGEVTTDIYTLPQRDRTWLILKFEAAHPDLARVINTQVPWSAKPIDMNGDGLQDFYQVTACADYNAKVDPKDKTIISDERCQEAKRTEVDSWINTGGALLQGQAFIRGPTSYPPLNIGPFAVDAAMGSARTLDSDGDGHQDVLFPTDDGWVVLGSTGSGSFEAQSLPFDLEWDYPVGSYGRPGADAIRTSEQGAPVLLDLNGDGITDVFKRHRTGVFAANGYTAPSEWQIMLRNGPSLPRMVNVTNGVGERVDATYTLLTDPNGVYAPNDGIYACTYPQRCAGLRRSVVSQHRLGRLGADGNIADVKLRYDHSYSDGRIDLTGRGFLGFRTRTDVVTPLTQPAGFQQITRSEFDNRTQDAATHLYYKAFAPEIVTDTRVDTARSTTYQSIVTTTYGMSPNPPAGTLHRFDLERDESATEAHGTASTTVHNWKILQTVDKYGNLVALNEGVPGSDIFDFQAAEGVRVAGITYKYTTDPAFDAPGLRHLVDQEQRGFSPGVQITSYTVVTVRTASYDYKPNGDLRLTVIEPTTTSGSSPNDAMHKEVELHRDDYGNVDIRTERATGFPDRVQHIDYDDNGYAPHHFPVEVINAKGQHSALQYDRRFGKLARVTDPNGASQDFYYDDFGRLVATQGVDGSISTVDFRSDFSGRPLQVQAQVAGGADTTVDYDWFGRPFHTSSKGFNDQDLVSDTTYDDLGRVVSQTRPHRVGEVVEALTATSVTYDVRGRPLDRQWTAVDVQSSQQSQQQTLDSTSCYDGLRECTRNARGFTRCVEHDQLGRVLKTWDPEAIAGAECQNVLDNLASRSPSTSYGYAQFLEKVTDAGSYDTVIQLDPYGRKLGIQAPSGISGYTWNGFGEMVASEDSNYHATQFAYDALGRMTLRSDADLLGSGVSGDTHWYFDGEDPDNSQLEPGEYIGSLTLSASPEGHREHYSYDTIGQLAQIDQTIANSTDAPLTARFEDYAFGRPQLIRYPVANGQGAFDVRRAYDAHGNLTQVTRDGQPAGTPPLWTLGSTSYYDQLTQENFGNGTNSQYQYDNLGQVQVILDQAMDASPMRILGLAYDQNGNLISRSEGSQSETLEYDQLDRMRFSTISGTQNETRYDPLGNITFRSESGLYTYGTIESSTNPSSGVTTTWTNPHAVAQVISAQGPASYTYDAVGQMTQRSTSTSTDHFSWTRFGKIAQMWRNGASPGTGTDVVTMSYDADGTRIAKSTALRTITYLGGLYEKRANNDGSTEHVYYIDNGARVISQVSLLTDGASTTSDVAYFHADHLGSAEVSSDATGFASARRSYGAFGVRRDPQNWLTPLPTDDGSRVTLSFTGHERDGDYDYGLTNMQGREYDAALGRFLSADPVVQAPEFSQSLNRYSYVWNNPLGLVDPSGYDELPAAGGAVEDPRRVANAPLDPITWTNAYTDMVDGVIWLNRQGDSQSGEMVDQSKKVGTSAASEYFEELFQSLTEIPVDPGVLGDRQVAALDTMGSAAYSGRGLVVDLANAVTDGLNRTVHDAAVIGFEVSAGQLAGEGLGFVLEEAAGAIGTALSGAGDVAADAAPAVEDAADTGTEVVQRAMSREELQAMKNSGLVRGGREGEHFVSDAVNSTATRAQSRLALKTTPEVRVTMEVPAGKFSAPSRVQPFDLGGGKILPGGGMERTATGNIPARVLRVDDL